ncbi:hypothetical protein [Arthrobacter sp. NPDC058192]|uniref:hypothetical protein n=1 Tax=Arthrobacter sp. NPDC058192 TaxID=3346372 RepID=UPI0036F04E20
MLIQVNARKRPPTPAWLWALGALVSALISSSQLLAFSALTSMRGIAAVAGLVIFLVGIVAFVRALRRKRNRS